MTQDCFITVEGVDGAGCGTQTQQLYTYLAEKEGETVEKLSYPDYSHATGRFIKQFLRNEFDLPPRAEFLMYALDMVKDADTIFTWLRNSQTVVADRYYGSTLAYQSVNGVDMQTMLHFVKLFNLPTPTLVLYLDVDTETSQERKKEEKNKLDRYEEDTEFRETVRNRYKELVKEEPLHADWIEIDASRSIDQVQTEIREHVEQHVKQRTS